MLKSILVPVDGSDHAEKAAKLAGDLSAKYGAELTLVYVRPSTDVPDALRHLAEVEFGAKPAPSANVAEGKFPATMQSGKAALQDYLLKIGEVVTERAAALARKHGAKDVRQAVIDGDPADAILKFAGDCKADMVVMGCRGLGKLEGILLGSVSQKVTQHAKCSCVVVR